jgi:TPR repeat protein
MSVPFRCAASHRRNVVIANCAVQDFPEIAKLVVGEGAGQNDYGFLLSRGDGGRRDIVEAWKWYELAAAAKIKMRS